MINLNWAITTDGFRAWVIHIYYILSNISRTTQKSNYRSKHLLRFVLWVCNQEEGKNLAKGEENKREMRVQEGKCLILLITLEYGVISLLLSPWMKFGIRWVGGQPQIKVIRGDWTSGGTLKILPFDDPQGRYISRTNSSRPCVYTIYKVVNCTINYLIWYNHRATARLLFVCEV